MFRWLGHLFVIDHAIWSDCEPSLPMRHLKEVPQSEYVILASRRAYFALKIGKIFEKQSACDRPCRHRRFLRHKEVREACHRLQASTACARGVERQTVAQIGLDRSPKPFLFDQQEAQLDV